MIALVADIDLAPGAQQLRNDVPRLALNTPFRKGTLLDPNLVDLFGSLVAGDDLRRRLEGRAKVLLVDPDPELQKVRLVAYRVPLFEY